MDRPPPNRLRVQRAINLARSDRSEALMPSDIALDAACMLIVSIDRRRKNREDEKISFDLRPLVTETAHFFFKGDPGRRYAYERVAMRYYTLMSQLAARNRRIVKMARERKRLQQKAA